jgi:hypothetical protein
MATTVRKKEVVGRVKPNVRKRELSTLNTNVIQVPDIIKRTKDVILVVREINVK